LKTWSGDAMQYKLSVKAGKIESTKADGEVY